MGDTGRRWEGGKREIRTYTDLDSSLPCRGTRSGPSLSAPGNTPASFPLDPSGRRVAKVSHSSQTTGASPSLPGSPGPALISTDSTFITLPPRKPLGTPSASCWSPDKLADLGTASWQPTLGDGRCLQELRQGEGRATPTSAKGQHAL